MAKPFKYSSIWGTSRMPNLNKDQIQTLLNARPDLMSAYAKKGKIDYGAVRHWFEKYGQMDQNVANIIHGQTAQAPAPAPAPTTPTATPAAPDTFMETVPEFLKSDPNFQKLPRDMQEMAVYTYGIQKQNDESKAKALSAAYDEAVKQADPYWKNIIKVAQDELLNSFSAQKGDYQAINDRLNQRISELNTDLQSGTEFMNLEQQQELANLALSYTKNRDAIVDTSSQQGLTFSTKRKLAEQQLGSYNQGMVESTKRQYQKQIGDLQREVDSGNLAATKDLEEAKRKYNEGILATGRTAERYLGTSNLPAMEGYTPLGTAEATIPGQLYEDKTRDITARQQALYGEATQSSLQY